MTLTSGIFNSVDGDRKYNAKWFASYFASFIGNGVFPNPSTNLQVIANTNMTTIVGPGQGWINGYYLVNDSNFVLNHDVADGVLKRIDRVVMRLNHLTRKIDVLIKKGTFSSTPVAPALQRNVDAYELALADVLINNGATVITQANITDQRLNSALCGIVHGVVDQVDTTTIFNQYQTWYGNFTTDKQVEFDAWIASLQDILSGDVAGNLLNLINSNTDALASHKADYIKHPGYGITTGSSPSYSITLDPAPVEYKDGMGLVIQLNTDTTNGPGSNLVIKVNGLGSKNILKPNGSEARNLKKGVIYSLRYSSAAYFGQGAFILQGEGGAEGNVTADKVLSGTTYTDPTTGDLKTGTMVNRGFSNIQASPTSDIAIPVGYYNGGKVLTPRVSAGDVVIYERTGISAGIHGVPSIRVDVRVSKAGVYRVTFTMRSTNPSGTSGNAQILVNSVPTGIFRTTSSGIDVTYVEDITVNASDSIKLSAYSNGASASNVPMSFKLSVLSTNPVTTTIV